MKILTRALAAFAAAALFGCHNGGSDQNSAQVRYLDAVVDSEPLDMLLDSNVAEGAVVAGTVTPFAEVGSGTHDLKVRSSTSQVTLAEKSISISSATNDTVLVYGKRAAINTVVVDDDATGPASSTDYQVRAVNLSPDVGLLDLYVAPGDATSTSPTLTGLGYGSLSAFAEAAAGSFKITLTIAGTKDVVFQSAAQTFAGGTNYTVVISPSFSGKLVNALLLVNSGSASALANPLGRLKAVNAIPDATPLNFKADGVTLLSAVPFTGASTYVTTVAGSRNLQLEAASSPGTILASTTQPVAAASDYTMLALGSFAQPQLAVLADDNSAPPSALLRIRFVNAMASGGAVDALVDFASQAAGIAPGTASAYSAIAPKTDYTVSFTTPGGVSQLATLMPVELDAGAVYSAYLFGTPAAAQARIVRDR